MTSYVVSTCLALTLVTGLTGAASAWGTTRDPSQYDWSEKSAGTALDLSNYTLAFSDDFNSVDLTADGGNGTWVAPVHASYGLARFDNPTPGNNTYLYNAGVLTIRAWKAADGKWFGGNVETVGAAGAGFAQQYGYFEARMKFPNMPGAWPAFWLKSQAEHTHPEIVRPEIDIIEWYGGDPTGLHRTVHLWPPAPPYLTANEVQKHWYKSNFSRQQALAGEWHTYGALITEEFVIVYVDRKEVSRFPTLDEFKTPLYPLVSLTLYSKDAALAVSPFDLQVDYVRIYKREGVSPNPPTSVEVR